MLIICNNKFKKEVSKKNKNVFNINCKYRNYNLIMKVCKVKLKFYKMKFKNMKINNKDQTINQIIISNSCKIFNKKKLSKNFNCKNYNLKQIIKKN